MDKLGDPAASKFINALIKSVQTLCHGYLDFQTGIEIIGHINLSVDKGGSLDYILKEKVCKNAENSTLFISNSFYAESKTDQEVVENNEQSKNQVVQNSESEFNESGRVSTAISSISSALTGSKERSRRSSGAKDSSSTHSRQNAVKRKASESENSESHPAKVSYHHENISAESSFPSSSRASPVDSKESLRALRADIGMSETMLPETANVRADSSDIGVNLAGSVLEPVEESQNNPDLPEGDDDSDGDLEVTFIKEEFVEGEISSCDFENSGRQQFHRGPHQRASEGMSDSSLFPVSLHTSSASASYVPSAHELGAAGQQYPPGTSGPSTSQPQPGPSGMRAHGTVEQALRPLPNGVQPECGYVHIADARKWMMYELVEGSGVYIHEKNYYTLMSKRRDGQLDGKAMVRYLMNCFWKQGDLVGASLAEPPRPNHHSLDKGIINSILDYCAFHVGDSRRNLQKAMWWMISAANARAKKKYENLTRRTFLLYRNSMEKYQQDL